MTRTSLYDLGSEWEALIDELYEAGGELSEEQEERLDELYGASDEKIDGYLYIRAEMKMLEEGAKAEAERLAKKATAAAATVKRLEERLAIFMERSERDTIERPLGKIRLMEASSQPVNVLVETDDLPEDYKKTKVVVTVDKTHLKNCLTSEVEEVKEKASKYAELGPRTKYIRVF